MKLVCKNRLPGIACEHTSGIGQERVLYKNVQVNGLNIFYREAGLTNGPVIPAASRRSNVVSHVSGAGWNHRLSPNTASSRQTFRASDILPGQTRKSSNIPSTILPR